MTRRKVRVVVTCSDRKSLPPLPQLQLRSVRSQPVAGAVNAWLTQLRAAQAEARPARELYQGEHWHVVKSLRDAAEDGGLEVDLWVASAGYGLLAYDEPIKSYGATFAPGHLDSVARFLAPEGQVARAWWLGLRKRARPDGAPGSISDLAAASSGAPLLVAAGSSYVNAVFDDLQEAKRRLDTPNSLHVISVGTQPSAELGDSLVPAASTMRAALGGTLVSLNARVLRYLLRAAPRHAFSPGGIRQVLDELTLGTGQGRPSRARQTDEAVRCFIETQLAEDSRASKSRLLQTFRSAGLACEQGRFGALFEEVKVGRER